jgi:hypothetical protein
MAGPARLITLNLGSQTIGLAEFRVAHGGLALVNYRLHECRSILRPDSNSSARAMKRFRRRDVCLQSRSSARKNQSLRRSPNCVLS